MRAFPWSGFDTMTFKDIPEDRSDRVSLLEDTLFAAFSGDADEARRLATTLVSKANEEANGA